MAHQRAEEAAEILREVGMPTGQSNERSALTLLGLLDLTPDKTWAAAEAPLMGVTPLMEFMAAHYGKQYAPNSRETVRRQTIHQFFAAGLVVTNPDNPGRPVNSGQTVYQVSKEFLDLVRHFGEKDWEERLAQWKKAAPTLVARWAREREIAMIPVTLPNGNQFALSPGGQNPLIKSVLEEFCPRFTPGAQVLYVGATEDKFVVWEREALAAQGVTVDEHGKMPDVVVLDVEHGWLILIEAVSSHGPMDAKRREELASLFANSAAGIVYVTAFMDRRTFAAYLPAISWATEVWLADAPSHLIHFDGDRFLGPYD